METIINKNHKFQLTENTKKIIVDFVTYIFVALFVYTAYSKFATIDGFERILRRSPLTGNFSAIIAWSVPLVESVIAILLLISLTNRLGLIASLLLMILFTGFLSYGILSGDKLPCHCGGVISSMSWQQHIWFNIGFIVLAIIGIKISKEK